MRNFQEKSRLKSFFHSWPVLIIMGMIILFFAWNVILLLGKMKQTKENKDLAEERVVELERKKEMLTIDTAKLDTDEGKETSIREKFGFAKEGEKLIVIVEEKNSSDTEEKPKKRGFFSFFFNLFK